VSTPLPLFAGEVEARSDEGERRAASTALIRLATLADLSRKERERCTASSLDLHPTLRQLRLVHHQPQPRSLREMKQPTDRLRRVLEHRVRTG
jgi:hypothetical protein